MIADKGPDKKQSKEELKRSWDSSVIGWWRWKLELPSAEEYTHYIKDVAAPVAALLREQTHERSSHIRRCLRDAAQRYARRDGSIRMVNEAVCIAGCV